MPSSMANIRRGLSLMLPAALLSCAAGAARADAGAPPGFIDNDFIGEQGQRDMFEPEDFTLDFGVSVPFAGGSLQPVSLGTNPVLGALTTGFQHAIYNFDACGVVYPHVHPRGDENVFAFSGTVEAGFVDEAGKLIRDPAIATGTAFVIPQGYVHYVANPTCQPARALVTLPSSDGGVYGALPAVLALPPNILQASTPSVPAEAISELQAAVAASGVIAVDPVCAARCAEAGDGSR